MFSTTAIHQAHDAQTILDAASSRMLSVS